MQCESSWHFQCYLKVVGTFSIILLTVHVNVCVIQYVKILLYACARYAYLSFSNAWLTMCCGDNLVHWHFQYYLVDYACEWFRHSKCEKLLYKWIRCAFSMITQTMCCRDNFASHAFKGYSILFHSIMIERLTPLICSILWYSS